MKITQIHNLLSKKELKKFGDFIKSPYFNSEPRFIKVYELLRSEGSNINRDIIAEKIFGKNSSTGDLRFRKLVSEFMKLFERFLAETEFSSDAVNKKFMILEKYKKMNLRKEFLEHADEAINYIEKYSVKDEIYYKNMTEVYAKKYSVEEINFKDYNMDLSFTINDFTDKYFAAMKIFIFNCFATMEYTFNIDLLKNKTFYTELLNYINSNSVKFKNNDPEIYLRYLTYELNLNGFNIDIYNEYLSILSKESNQLKINEYSFFSILLNILSKFINDGQAQYCEKVIEVTKLMEQKDLYVLNGITYINLKIVTESSISMGEYDWALNFTNRHKDYILHENKVSVFKLISGKLYFFKKDFNKAKELLSGISINDYIHYTEAKLIECRIEFESENLNAVMDLVSTTKKYLLLHKDIGKHFSRAYKMFLDSLLKIVRLIDSKQNNTDIVYELEKIERDITEYDVPIYAQSWLIHSINEIKKGRS